MKKTMKTSVCCLLALALILTMPVVAEALSIPKAPGQVMRTEILEIPGALEADQRIRTIAVYETPVAMRPLGFGEYTTDPEEAGAVIRKAMIDRADSVTVYYEEDASVPFSQIVDELLAVAMAHTGEPAGGDYLRKHRGRINTSASYYPGGATNQYDITLTLSYYTTADQEQAVTEAVEDLLTSLNLDGLSDYEKFQAVYGWMCQNITYDYDNLGNENYELQYTAYGALIDRTSVCQGYANLLYRLMLELGIDCRLITGDAGGGHAWNIIKLDGLYYNADSTWDASWTQAGLPYNFCLRCPANFTDHVRDPEYDTAEFHAQYPMGESDYSPCEHAYSAVETVAPTCSEQGYTRYVCSLCGSETYGDYVDPVGHNYVEDFIPPTCTGVGYVIYSCSNCGDTYGQEIPELGHTYVTEVTEPTCEEPGYTTYTCSFCGDSYKEEIPELGHDMGIWYVEVEPGEYTEGLERRNCMRCDYYEENVLPAIGHTHSYESVVTEPTCTEGGYTTHTCAGCGDTYTDSETAKLGHDMGIWYVEVEPGEYTEGLERRNCMRCDYYEENVLPAIGHTHSYESVVTEPTCTEGGYTTYTCIGCGDSYTDDETDALGHAMSQWTQIQAPTCTEGGQEQSVCDRCGHTENRAVEAAGHSYTSVTTEPTCTAGGCTTYTCQACGDSYEDDHTDALGHDYEEGTCTRCGASEKLPGDVNGDGRVNARDARALLRFIAGMAEPGEVDEGAADFNGDGRVNARDARAILRAIAGLD